MTQARATLRDMQEWPPTVGIPDAARALGISRSYGFELAKLGQFPARTITVGSRRRVITASLVELLDAAAE